MLNSSILAFDGAGRIRNRNAATPTDFNGGTPIIIVGGVNLLCGNNVAPDVYLAGLPYTTGGILGMTSIGAVALFNGGIPQVANDSVAIDTATAIGSYVNGLPICTNGKLAVAVAE